MKVAHAQIDQRICMLCFKASRWNMDVNNGTTTGHLVCLDCIGPSVPSSTICSSPFLPWPSIRIGIQCSFCVLVALSAMLSGFWYSSAKMELFHYPFITSSVSDSRRQSRVIYVECKLTMHTNAVLGRPTYVEGILYCLCTSYRISNFPDGKVYQRLGPRLILKYWPRYLDHPSPNFYRAGRSKIQKIGVDFRPHHLWVNLALKCSNTSKLEKRWCAACPLWFSSAPPPDQWKNGATNSPFMKGPEKIIESSITRLQIIRFCWKLLACGLHADNNLA